MRALSRTLLARSLLALAVAGCNQVLGLDRTELADASPPGEAGAGACPAGVLAAFTGVPAMVIAGSCDSFTINVTGTRAVAHCGTAIVEGGPAGPFAPSVFDLPGAYDSPRLSPSGGELYVRIPGATPKFFKFVRAGTGWEQRAPVDLHLQPPGATDTVSVTTQGSGLERRMIYQHNSALWDEQVVAQDPTMESWNIATGGVQASTFALSAIGDPMLTPDGLRMIFRGSTNGTTFDIYAAQRTTLDDTWGPAITRIHAAPPGGTEGTPFLAADCQRLYYAENGAIYTVGR